MPQSWPESGSSPCQFEFPIKFQIDENLPEEVADLLQEAGFEAATVPGQRLTGASDADLARACGQEAYALITLDTDFGDIRTYPPREYPGLIVLRLRRQDKAHVLEILPRLIQMFATEPLTGRLWIVEEDRVRVRE